MRVTLPQRSCGQVKKKVFYTLHKKFRIKLWKLLMKIIMIVKKLDLEFFFRSHLNRPPISWLFLNCIFFCRYRSLVCLKIHLHWPFFYLSKRSNNFKRTFRYPQFFQKTNEKIGLNYYYTSGWIFSFVFWKNLKTPKKHFEINWPIT